MQLVNMHILFYVLFLLFFGTAAYAGWRGAPWVPTRKRELHTVLSFLQSHPPRTYAIDLGCGTGSLLFLLAKAYPSMALHGYDVSFGPLLFGWIRKWLSPRRYAHVHLHWKNLYHVDVSMADLLFVFMMPEPHTHIAKTVLRNANADALVLFEAWAPEGFSQFQKIASPGTLPIFTYPGKAFLHKK